MQKEFASKCGTSLGYLRKAISKNHELGPALCVLIEKHSFNQISRQSLHPNDWDKIWPELKATAPEA
jgi:DNA-binding transcriptional regulator YdaS (Cro superfamily)